MGKLLIKLFQKILFKSIMIKETNLTKIKNHMHEEDF